MSGGVNGSNFCLVSLLSNQMNKISGVRQTYGLGDGQVKILTIASTSVTIEYTYCYDCMVKLLQRSIITFSVVAL